MKVYRVQVRMYVGKELIVETFYSTMDRAREHLAQYENKPQYIAYIDTIQINE